MELASVRPMSRPLSGVMRFLAILTKVSPFSKRYHSTETISFDASAIT